MSEGGMSGEQIERVFGTLSRIEQKIDSHIDVMEKHTAHDETVHVALFSRVEALQLSHAKQRGFITAVVSLGSIVGAGVGYAIEFMLGRHT